MFMGMTQSSDKITAYHFFPYLKPYAVVKYKASPMQYSISMFSVVHSCEACALWTVSMSIGCCFSSSPG